MSFEPPSQYATDANLRNRQRLWEYQQPRFDIVSWVLQLAGLTVTTSARVLDVGCGNGSYLARIRAFGIDVVGGDLSRGMLSAAAAASGPGTQLVNSDAVRLPFVDNAFDVVLAPHMLYHVADRRAAALEMRRVLRPGGCCVVVTNGADHMRSLRAIVESAVRRATSGWEMRDPATSAFSLENGAAQLQSAFQRVTCVRANDAVPVVLTDAAVAADYVASTGDRYQPETERPWAEVVEEVRRTVQRVIDDSGSFVVCGSTGAFVCE